jgi:Uma2 family endonuclease
MALPVAKVSLQEYLEDEESSDRKHEYLDGEVFEMEAASISHTRIVRNLVGRLDGTLAGKGCEALPGARVATGERRLYTYPGIVVVCGKVETWPVDRNTIANPRLIIEVLSPSTEGYDRGRKFDSYRALASLAEYVTVAQESAAVLQHILTPEGWRVNRLVGMDAVLRFESIPAEIRLGEIYRDVEFAPAEV